MPQRIRQFRPGKRVPSRPVWARRDPFYRSKAWVALRRWFMARPENALCAECRRWGRKTPAVICDHIVPRQVEPGRQLDASNLQALCRPCDNRKRARDVARGDAGAGARPSRRRTLGGGEDQGAGC